MNELHPGDTCQITAQGIIESIDEERVLVTVHGVSVPMLASGVQPVQIKENKHRLLTKLEEQTLLVAGEIAMAKIGYFPNITRAEESLGEILTAILMLKKLENIPSNIKLASEE